MQGVQNWNKKCITTTTLLPEAMSATNETDERIQNNIHTHALCSSHGMSEHEDLHRSKIVVLPGCPDNAFHTPWWGSAAGWTLCLPITIACTDQPHYNAPAWVVILKVCYSLTFAKRHGWEITQTFMYTFITWSVFMPPLWNCIVLSTKNHYR